MRIAAVQSMQQNFGNRAVQRFLKRPSASVQRQPATTDTTRLSQGESKIAFEAKADVEERHWRLPELERHLLTHHWSSIDERRLYTKHFLLYHYRFYAGEQLDPDARDMQLLYYEQLYRKARPKGTGEEIGSSSGDMKWLDDAVKTPEERLKEQDTERQEIGKYTKFLIESEREKEAKEKQMQGWRAERERKQRETLTLPAAKNAFHGVQIFFLVRSLPGGGLMETARVLDRGPFKLLPYISYEDGQPTVLYFVAHHMEDQQDRFIIGPDSLGEFLDHMEDYDTKGGIYYMWTVKGEQPDQNYADKVRMGDAMIQGDLKGATYVWAKMWTKAVRDPWFWINLIFAGLMASGGGGGPQAEPGEVMPEMNPGIEPVPGEGGGVPGGAPGSSMGGGKIPWGSWEDYPKVEVGGQEYAQVGGRLYSRHAVDRMQPSGQRYGSSTPDTNPLHSPPVPRPAGSPPEPPQPGVPPRIYQTGGNYDYGRSVAPQYVEEVIANSPGVTQPNGNISHELGDLQVILSPEGRVVTIITK